MVPCSLILWSNPCFCYLIRKFAFLWGKIIIHKQQCTRMCRGWGWGWGGGGGGGGGGAWLVSRGGRKVQLVRWACMPTIHWCVWNCHASAQWFNTAMLPSIKRWGIISCHDFVLSTLNSSWDKSRISLCESAQRRGSHDLLCFYINTLRPSDKLVHHWFMSSLV